MGLLIGRLAAGNKDLVLWCAPTPGDPDAASHSAAKTTSSQVRSQVLPCSAKDIYSISQGMRRHLRGMLT